MILKYKSHYPESFMRRPYWQWGPRSQVFNKYLGPGGEAYHSPPSGVEVKRR